MNGTCNTFVESLAPYVIGNQAGITVKSTTSGMGYIIGVIGMTYASRFVQFLQSDADAMQWCIVSAALTSKN